MKAKAYYCPRCGAEVPLRNIHVEKDILLCGACGEISSFAVAAGLERDDDRDFSRLAASPPPRHVTLVTETDPTDGREKTVLTYWAISPLALFLVPFTCLWAGGSMSTAYGVQIMRHQFDWIPTLFGIPFLIGSIFLVSSCIHLIFGKMVLTLKRGRGRYFVGVGSIGMTKCFDYTCGTKVYIGNTLYRANGRSLPLVELKTPGQPATVRLFANAKEDVIEYVIAVIRREIHNL